MNRASKDRILSVLALISIRVEDKSDGKSQTLLRILFGGYHDVCLYARRSKQRTKLNRVKGPYNNEFVGECPYNVPRLAHTFDSILS